MNTNNPLDESLTSRMLLEQCGITEHLRKDGLTDLAINRPGELWTKVGGVWQQHQAPVITPAFFFEMINALAIMNGGHITRGRPIASVTLPDGERGWIVTPPACASFNCSLTIRKPSKERFSLESYRRSGRFDLAKGVTKLGDKIQPHEQAIKDAISSGDVETVARLAVEHKLNVLMGGKVGSGKTTFMKTMVDMYPPERRYTTIEDSLEVDMPYHLNTVRLLYSDIEGGVTPKKLIESCMRMMQDHVFLTELKGDEAWSYLTLLQTGMTGSLTSAHINDSASFDIRLAQLVKQSPVGITLDYDLIIKTVRQSIDLVFFWEETYLKEIYYNPEGQLNLKKGLAYDAI